MTDQEIRQLAVDISEGRVFGTWNLLPGEGDLIPIIFMPVALMPTKDIPDDLYHVYEYIAKAGPRGVNGYPMFMSCRFLNKELADEVFPLVSDLIKEREKFISGKE